MMEPSEHLRQLRKQRQLVAQHLAWLDEEISRAEELRGSTQTPAEAIVPESAPLPPLAAEPGPTIETLEPESHAVDQARRNRLGCILVALIATAALLFLIWGLPQILYP